MITPQGRAYLDKLYHYLEKLPEAERLDAVREIESHIAEGTASGEAEAAILARLGEPRKLARAYRSERLMGSVSMRSLKDVLSLVGFYCTAGLLSVLVVPFLAVVAYGFGFCSVLVLLAGVIRSFGVTWINMSIGPGIEVPTAWSMAFALPVAGIVGGIAFVSWRGLRKYLTFLSARYRAAIPVKPL
ncbi:DUF1700 domain-containing protein [Cohnella sp. REN36]|uniref:DUF1700 domain-containing protein n=1 Tax=Cohnella sp. REN36 TaxID=2887347 RepID=UPI001D14FF4B|nr:DUF1700 domain-containing protein [Cohnella sp. REN36]MCC3375316.1 DUF1700 domain-containing protein [Cohnella sp. REN36]